MIVRFVDIDGIVDHHCLNFLFVIMFTDLPKQYMKPYVARNVFPWLQV